MMVDMEKTRPFMLCKREGKPYVDSFGLDTEDFRCYSGIMRKLVREWEKCEIDQYSLTPDCRRPTTGFLRLAAENNLLLNNEGDSSFIAYKPGLHHIAITVKNETDKNKATVGLSIEGETSFLFLTESMALCSDNLYEIPGLDNDSVSLLPMQTGTITRDKLPFCLSLLVSELPGATILWEGYEVKEHKPINAENALFFRDVNKFENLFVDTGVSLPSFGFIRNKGLSISRLVTVNEQEHTIMCADIIFPNPAPEEVLKKLLGKKALKNTHEEDGRFVFDGEMAVEFLKTRFPDLVASFRLYQPEILKHYKIAYAKPHVTFHVTSGIDFLEGTANITVDEESFTLSTFLSMLEKQGFVKLSDGTETFVDKEFVTRLERLISHKEGKDRISFYDIPIINKEGYSFDDDSLLTDFSTFYQGFNTLSNGKRQFPLKESKLRPYQEYGCKWLSYLDENHKGGCLADEMGLGKTVQVIAFLASRKPTEKNSLLVAPTSILVNWEREILRFSSLPCMIYHGSERNTEMLKSSKGTIIISSYATVRNDIGEIASIPFDYLILDESQNIKTETSQTTKAMQHIKSDHRLAISGTPLENHVSDLFSLFRFLNPSMFPTESMFVSQYEKPIENGNDEALSDLKLKIYPFILRRTKQTVLPELPPITKQISMIAMKDDHLKAYEEKRKELKERLGREVKRTGFQKNSFLILQALTELRQYATLPESKTGDGEISAKREYLIATLPEIVPEHKVLIFTNFLDTIERVGEDLEAMGIGFLTMTGSTTNRQLLLDSFQNDPQCRVCLMTLKTGGVGLNLTAADYVFIMDPWWNMAAEEQAINRTHRIGQENPVFCYRLIAKDTIEEKMLQLQQKKAFLASSLLQNDQAGIKKLTEADLEVLLG